MMNLMDFDCEQRGSVHFFYTLPYSKRTALVETTWLSEMNDDSQKDYDQQIKEYIENNLKIKDYKITYKEVGAIPLFYPTIDQLKNKINIGTAGGMTRLSTGYTFLNIQEQSKYIRENIENINKLKRFQICFIRNYTFRFVEDPDLEGEMWKPIPAQLFPGKKVKGMMASNLGRILNRKGVKTYGTPSGKYLSCNNLLVHRLVAAAWLCGYN